ncbi:FAD-binding protein [Glaciihabitans arcticus]|uniref:FAD-binding protein n=1 Tax=Glaciihabitans arcticus TaxID=2668039 RepID=A0A4Q9GNY6_9MICO|nr:FAD-linked oxidase C-terminal domain-containing protein [Glaciihabitans arcticus]TBN56405.1 FAD-binding protein [Glaciihabitans arcticus]
MTSTLAKLSDTLGDIVSVSTADLEAARADKSGHVSDAAPLAVVHARSIDDVQRTMRYATETGTPVVTRGAGTGLAGGAIAGAGEIVLSTIGMNRILEISRDDELAVVQPGVINADLNTALEPSGLWFAPDPASRAISTIGGNIATNAGGLLCAKYGVTRESVLGVKVVLADGRLMEFGHRTVKGVTGLDLAGLMIGSEGTLGVIVEATVKVQALPQGIASTIGAWFASVEDAARAAAVITATGIRPAIMELLDPNAMASIADHLGLDVRPGQSFLLVQTDGHGASVGAENALAVIRSLGGDAEHTTDPAESARLFGMRRAFHPAMEARGTVLIEDVCVPRSALPAMFNAITAIAGKHGVDIATVAHAGDGNLHPNFVFQGVDVPAAVWAAADELFLTALRLGGTLTGEHGVGLLKKRWLGEELGSEQLELQRSIKGVFDPQGLLNRGKVF